MEKPKRRLAGRYNPVQCDESLRIHEMHEAGMHKIEIAKAIGRTLKTVYNVLKRDKVDNKHFSWDVAMKQDMAYANDRAIDQYDD